MYEGKIENGVINGYCRNLKVIQGKQGYSSVCNIGYWKQDQKSNLLIPYGKFAQMLTDPNMASDFKIPLGIYLGVLDKKRIRV